MPSPALLFYPELIRANVAEAIRIAGSSERLRPHVKTHKTVEIARIEIGAGITRFKCATVAEAEMLGRAGAEDVLLAYPMVGPNARRFAELVRRYPGTRFSCLIDDADAARALARTMHDRGETAGVWLDIDCGQHRTGVEPGEEAAGLYALAESLPGLRPMGLHVYDGHNHQPLRAERESAVHALLEPVLKFRERLRREGHAVPGLVCGGTPTFPVFASLDLPGLELSPGTFVLHDVGYGSKYEDMPGFVPAAALLTRVISKPSGDRLTLDLGTKAVASDPPAGGRCRVPEIPDAKMVGHNEEHLVIETASAGRFRVGDVLYAFPTHVCPTCALYRTALVVEGGRVTGEWEIASRDRKLSI